MLGVCFVCLGNICRSPTAEGVFRELARRRGLRELLIDSAGTAAYHAGESADRRSARAARERGYALTSIARQFVADDFQRFEYVLAMDRENLKSLKALVPGGFEGHLRLLRDFDPASPPGSDVPDPYYGGEQGFQRVLDLCEAACEGLLTHIGQRREASGVAR